MNSAAAAAIVIDTTAPDAPTVAVQTTNATPPTITGTNTTLAGDEVLSVVVNGATYEVTPTTTTWSLDLAAAVPTAGTLGAFADGTYAVTATVTDEVGNEASTSVANALVVDTTAPSAPTVDALVADSTTPTITGTAILGDGETLTVTVSGATYNVTPEIDNTWSVDLASASPASGALVALGDGNTYSVTATSTDAATNAVNDSTTEELVVDTTAPTIAAVSSSTADGSYGAGQAVVISIQMSEDVTVDTALGSPTLTLDAGTASFTGAAGNVLTFTYTSEDGDNSSDLDVSALSLNGSVIEDAAGNAADFTGIATQLSAAAAIVIDTTAPDAPTVDVQTTNATPPTITGTNTTLAGDEVLSVVVNGATYEVTPTTTTWSLDLAAAVPTAGTLGAFVDGTYAVTATVTDEVGNEASTSVANALVVDTTAPAAPTVDALVADSTTPTITGTAILGDGESLTVTVSGATYNVTPEIDNTWSVDLATASPASGALVALGDGNTYSVTATSTDAATNAVNDSTTEELVVDTTAPTIAAVSSSTADGSYGAGQAVVISIQMSEDVTVDTALGSPTLTLDAGTASFTGAAGNVLTFTYTSEDGDNSSDLDVSALSLNGSVIEDAAGNAADFTGIATQLSAAAAIVIDTTAPDAPTVDVQTTNATPPTITGTNTTLAGDEVLSVVVNGATYEVTPTTTTWSLDLAAAVPTAGTLGAFVDGTYAVTATVTDEVGNEASTSVANALVVDTTAPSAPTVDALVADSTTPTITGTAILGDGESLTVTVSGATYNVTPEIDNTWSVDLASATPASGALVALGDGNTYSVTATSTDAATNAVNDSTTEELVVDTTAPTIAAVSSSTADGSYGAGQAVVISIQMSEDVTVDTALGSPTLTLDAGTASFTGAAGNVLTFTYTSEDGDNSSDLDVSALSLNGSVIEDAAGNAADFTGIATQLSAAAAIVIDTTAPDAPTVDVQTTNATPPTITGTNTTLAGDEVLSVVVNGATYEVTPTTTTWSLDLAAAVPTAGTLGAFVDGTYAVTATVTDEVGNEASTSVANALVVDTTAPSAPTVDALVADSTTPTITGTAILGDGEILTVTVSGATYNVTPEIDNTWSVDLASASPASGALVALGDGNTYSVTATSTDAATNAVNDSTTEELVVDTTAPTIAAVSSSTADGSYGAGQAVVISIQMSEDVTVDTALGSPTLTLDAGTASFTGAAGNVLTFTYTSEDGDNSSDLDVSALSLNGSVIEDAAGNAADFTGIATQLSAAAAIVIDTTAPDAPTVDVQTTNATPPTITGTNTTLAGDEVLSVVVNGATYEVTPTTTTWSLDLAAAVPTAGTLGAFVDGTYAVTATVTDEVGNEASTSVANALVVDTTAPSAPTVDALVADSTTPTITGTAILGDGETLTVTVSGATYNVTPEIDNTWSVDLASATSEWCTGRSW